VEGCEGGGGGGGGHTRGTLMPLSYTFAFQLSGFFCID